MSVSKSWRTYLRLFVGQMKDRTVPFRQRWIRAHRMGCCGYLLTGNQPITRKHLSWIRWEMINERNT